MSTDYFGSILQEGDVGSLQALLALLNAEFDLLAFFEGAETITLDSRKVNEYISAIFLCQKAVALGIIEPFYRTGNTISHLDFSF
jgi:hypothetical protein